MDEFGFWIFIAVMCILFIGEPDLHDVILNRIN